MQVSHQVKAGDQPQQAEGGPEVPPEENPPPPINPTPGTSKDPTPGTSKDPTDAQPTVPTQDPIEAKAEEVEVETPPELTAYVKSYKLAGKNWLDTVLDQKEQAYDKLYDRLVKIGAKHKENLDQAVKAHVFGSIKDRSGKCLSEDAFAMYEGQEDPPKKLKYRLTDDVAKAALKDYYDAVDALSSPQNKDDQSLYSYKIQVPKYMYPKPQTPNKLRTFRTKKFQTMAVPSCKATKLSTPTPKSHQKCVKHPNKAHK